MEGLTQPRSKPCLVGNGADLIGVVSGVMLIRG